MTARPGKETQAHDRYPLRTAARLTGLSPDLIRAWEKRYGVVAPIRGPRGARLYTQTDIDHLARLAKLVAQGRAIGDIAVLDAAALRALDGRGDNGAPATKAQPTEIVGAVIDLVEKFKLPELEVRLGEALLALGAARFVEEVARPVLIEVGDRWAAGRLTIAEEHLVSAAMRHVIGGLIRLRVAEPGPALLLATPAGELHEIGLMLAGLRAVDLGLRTYLLGANLPADEIVGAARRSGVDAVGLSVLNPENRNTALEQVRRIENDLPSNVELWLGGGDAGPLAAQLTASRALVLDDSETVEFHLKRLRGKPQTGRA